MEFCVCDLFPLLRHFFSFFLEYPANPSMRDHVSSIDTYKERKKERKEGRKKERKKKRKKERKNKKEEEETRCVRGHSNNT